MTNYENNQCTNFRNIKEGHFAPCLNDHYPGLLCRITITCSERGDDYKKSEK